MVKGQNGAGGGWQGASGGAVRDKPLFGLWFGATPAHQPERPPEPRPSGVHPEEVKVGEEWFTYGRGAFRGTHQLVYGAQGYNGADVCLFVNGTPLMISFNTPLVIGFGGKIGAGKTTVTKSLAEVLKWPRAAFGDFVRRVVRDRGLAGTRHNLQEVGTELLLKDIRSFCSAVISNSDWKPGENLILDGIRHVETIPVIRDLVRPARFRFVFLSLAEGRRIARLKERGDGDEGLIVRVDQHSSEQQVNSVLLKAADLVLDADRPTGIIVADIVEWVRTQ